VPFRQDQASPVAKPFVHGFQLNVSVVHDVPEPLAVQACPRPSISTLFICRRGKRRVSEALIL